MKHLVNWIEIPVADITRAKAFYGKILGVEFHDMAMGPISYALFPTDDRHNCGALAQGSDYRPGSSGPVIYLDGGDDLDKVLSKVKPAGGQVMLKKTFLSDQAGFIGMFTDSEGNRIGVHNPK
jgi:predicted enzyme related to lactoylglutathione lyase